MEHGGKLPVKDSVETREGLIFIRMTDPRVRRERPTWQGNTAEHQLTSTCVKNCFACTRLQKGAAKSGVPLQRDRRTPHVHPHYITAPKILNSVTAQGDDVLSWPRLM